MNRQTYLEINKSNFKYNIEQINKYSLDREIMPVIKANGYGTYINKCLDLIIHKDSINIYLLKFSLKF